MISSLDARTHRRTGRTIDVLLLIQCGRIGTQLGAASLTRASTMLSSGEAP
jgi:hypothetical protein